MNPIRHWFSRLHNRLVATRVLRHQGRALQPCKDFEEVRQRVGAVEGFLLPKQAEWLFCTVRSLPERARVLEIGAYKGRSSVTLGYACVGSQRHVFAVDPFSGVYEDIKDRERLRRVFERGFFNEWEENIVRNGLVDYVTPFVCTSMELARIWAAPIHFLFIDGSHAFNDVMADFQGFYPRVVPDGIIALHDVVEQWPGPLRAWNEYVKPMLSQTGHVQTLAYGHKPK